MNKIKQINKNDILDIQIEYLNDKFEGISEFFDIEANQSKKLIVPNSISGESLKVKVLKAEINSSVVFCKIVEYIDPVSKKRNFNFSCKNKTCSGCDFSHLNYIDQIETKKEYLEHLFPNTKINYELENYQELGYRNKINLPIQFDAKSNRYIIGLYKKNSHNIVDFNNECLVIDKEMNDIISSLKTIFNENKSNSKFSSMILTNLFIRGSKEFGYQVGVSYKKGNNYSKKLLKSVLLRLADMFHETIFSIFINQNDENKGNSILIDNPNFITIENSPKREFIELEVLSLKYKILPQSFFQINIVTLQGILNELKKFFEKKISEIGQIVDFFSGVGVLSDIFEDIYKKANCKQNIDRICLEINDTSFRYVNKDNATKQFNSSYEVINMTDKEISLDNIILDKNNVANELFIFDPPRKGIGVESLKIIEKYKPKYVVCLSCNPISLKKDLNRILDTNNGYTIKLFKGFDMFPQTTHIESLVILER